MQNVEYRISRRDSFGAGCRIKNAGNFFLKRLLFIGFMSMVYGLWSMDYCFAEETKTEEVNIFCNGSAEYMGKNKVALLTGGVTITQGNLKITAERVRVKNEAGDSRIRQAVANGSVKITKEDLLATSEEAIFHNDEQKIVLTGNPEVTSEAGKFSGRKITVYLKEDRFIIEENVRGIIFPKR
jgi:lipopolysaccharide export system protein LptA